MQLSKNGIENKDVLLYCKKNGVCLILLNAVVEIMVFSII